MTTIDQALAAIQGGLIIGLPTDTVYGIASNPLKWDAVSALFAAKRRSSVKPIPLLAADVAGVRQVALLDDAAADLAAPHWPGGLTLVLTRAPGMPDSVGDAVANTVGVRIPNHPVALALLARSGPLAVTSANRSGMSPARDEAEARAVFGGEVAEYLPGRGHGDAASTVVDLTGSRPRVLRRGAVEWELS